MNKELLKQTAEKLMANGKGILAADESNSTAGKRLSTIGIENTEENRRLYRQLFFGTKDFEKFISGVILYDETFWQKEGEDENSAKDGETYPKFLSNKGVIPGIKIDQGLVSFETGEKPYPDMPASEESEKITSGLNGLKERAQKYFDNGALFTKWRSLFQIDLLKGWPTDEVIIKNAEIMTEYAKVCQSVGLVPIVEPEVWINGPHSLEKSEQVTTLVIKTLFEKIQEAVSVGEIYLPGLILKTSMVIQGNENPDESSPSEIAEATVRMLKETVPHEIGGVVFLSGGQTAVEASAHLDAIAEKEPLPFEIAFSFARAIQGPALTAWKGKAENIAKAREEFVNRLKLNQLADSGDYDIEMEYLD